MTALYIILGIILFFIAVLSIPVVLDLEYTDAVRCKVSWLFLKFTLYPFPEKKPKEEKPAAEKKEEKPEEKKEEAAKPKKENFLKTFYNNQGICGVIELLNNCVSALKRFSVKFIKRAVIIKKFYLDVHITEGDAAATAIKYGKVCSALYPSLGFICSNMKVKDYKVNVFADYCGEKTSVEFITKTAFIPRALINAGIALVFSLLKQLLKVVISNIKSSNNNTKRKAD
ncbi:MAG: DUF2953 domain-containing protein [Clostridiaceae bacterium]|nr:DUF2953 domain-containing protein [Clostridiaceae bacterium]